MPRPVPAPPSLVRRHAPATTTASPRTDVDEMCGSSATVICLEGAARLLRHQAARGGGVRGRTLQMSAEWSCGASLADVVAQTPNVSWARDWISRPGDSAPLARHPAAAAVPKRSGGDVSTPGLAERAGLPIRRAPRARPRARVKRAACCCRDRRGCHARSDSAHRLGGDRTQWPAASDPRGRHGERACRPAPAPPPTSHPSVPVGWCYTC